MQNQFVRLYFNRPFGGNLDQLRLIPIQTPKGPVPLAALAKIDYGLTANKIERNQMRYSLDGSGYRSRRAISTLSEGTRTALGKAGIKGVEISREGDIKQMKDSFGRMIKSFGTIAGMIPIAFEWAVGLERLSPLADVAVGGLLIGTVLTLIYIPMFAYSVESNKRKI